MLKPEDDIFSKKAAKKKSRVRLRDLPAKKEARGGGGSLYPNDEPLPIPPRGFITPSENTKND